MTDAFTRLDRISTFRAAFNQCCGEYTHTPEFAESVKETLAAVTVDNHDVMIDKLAKILADYPVAARETFENEDGDVKLPRGRDLHEKLENFAAPMLRALGR